MKQFVSNELMIIFPYIKILIYHMFLQWQILQWFAVGNIYKQ